MLEKGGFTGNQIIKAKRYGILKPRNYSNRQTGEEKRKSGENTLLYREKRRGGEMLTHGIQKEYLRNYIGLGGGRKGRKKGEARFTRKTI